MHVIIKPTTLRWPILLVALAVVVALTTLPESAAPVEWTRGLFVISGHPALRDAVGHAALYGTLTVVLYWTLRGRVGFRGALALALGTALLLGLTTELAQRFAPGRTVQLSDLLGNWLGIMTVALLICFHQSGQQSQRH